MMKINDFDQVKNLIAQLDKINSIIKECDIAREKLREKEALGVESLWGCLSQRSDGSGISINLTGCYVFPDMINATQEVLIKRRGEVIRLLRRLGVEVEEDYDER